MKNSLKNIIISRLIYSFFIIVILFSIPNSTFAYPCIAPNTPIGCNPNEPLNGTTPPKNGTVQTQNGTIPPENGTIPPKNGTIPASGTTINTKILNPLSSDLDTIPKFILAILNFVLMIGVPIVTLAIIYAGFLFVTATGNSEKLKTAKQALIYTLIGAALLLGSLVISSAIKGTVDEIKNAESKQ